MIHKRIEEDLFECRLFLLKADGMWRRNNNIKSLCLWFFPITVLWYTLVLTDTSFSLFFCSCHFFSYWYTIFCGFFFFFLTIISCEALSPWAGILSIYFRYLSETLLPQWNFRCLSPGRDESSNLIASAFLYRQWPARGTSEDLQKMTASFEVLQVLPSFRWLQQWTHTASRQRQPVVRAQIASWKSHWRY